MSSESSYDNGRLVVTRIFDAKREAVFDAWIETSKVELWWGCGVASEVKSQIEAKVGGKFAHDMTLTNGGEYEHHGIIIEYDPPELLAYRMTDRFHDKPMMVRVEFTELGERTQVRLTQDNLLEDYSPFVMAGWTSAFEKLNELLNQEVFQQPTTNS